MKSIEKNSYILYNNKIKGISSKTALTGAVILIALYVSSIIFALMDSPLAENLLLASLFCTIVIPAVLYGYAVALRYFKKKK